MDLWSKGVDLWSQGVDLRLQGVDLRSEGVHFEEVCLARRTKRKLASTSIEA